MTKAHLLGPWPLGLLCALALSAPAYARAQGFLDIRLEQARQLTSSDVLDPFTATLSASASGKTTALWGTAGASFSLKCVVIQINDQAASLFEYTFDTKPTQCDAVIVHDDGFFIRGSDPSLGGVGNGGFTASIDKDGLLEWEIPDRDLITATATAQGGSGEFIGRYLGTGPLLAYHAPTGVLLGFSEGELEIVTQKRVVYQAHVIEQDKARLRVTGRTFGSGGTGKILGVVTLGTRTTFLLAYATSLGDGVHFVTYDGRQSLDAWVIPGTPKEWKGRTLQLLTTLTQDEVALLWSDGSSQWATLAGPTGTLRWERKLATETPALTPAPLGRVTQLGADEGHLYAWHTNAANENHLSVYDRENGEQLGVVALAGRRAQVGAALGLVQGARGVRLLTTDRVKRQLTEYALSLGGELEPPTEEMGAGARDMGQDQGNGGSPGAQTEEGCGCGQALGGKGPADTSVLMVLCLLGMRGARRRQKQHSSLQASSHRFSAKSDPCRAR